MYFEDLSSAGGSSLHVGWLDNGHSFNKGRVNRRVIFELVKRIVDEPKNKMRGFHTCQICGAAGGMWAVECNGKFGGLGHAEVWVKAHGVTYVAPTLILHYIVHHAYRPPTEFIEALNEKIPDSVLRAELDGDYNAGKFTLSQENGFSLDDTMKVLADRHGLTMAKHWDGVEEWKRWFVDKS